MILTNIDLTIRLVPATQPRIRLALHWAQRAGDKTQDACYAATAVARYEKLFDAQIGVTDAEEEDVFSVIELDEVVPEVADKFAGLVFDFARGGAVRVDARGGLAEVDVKRDVDIHDAEAVVGCPVDIGREGVDLLMVLDDLESE